jgi:LPS export ABC transporter permease LptF/LPS export ABC transporter permease LptG
MLKSFDRYILKEIASPFALGLIVYTFTMMIDMIFYLSGTLIAKEASMLTVINILLYMMPDFLSFTIPMSTLMGVLAGLSRMSTDSEIIAFRTMGINNLRVLKPVMIFSITAWLFSSWLIMYLAPEGSFRLNQLLDQIKIKRTVSELKPGDFYADFEGYTLYFDDIDPNTNEWKDVFLYSRQRGERDTIILAKSGFYVQELDEKNSCIVLKDALVHSFEKKTPDKSYELTHYNSLKEKVPNRVAIKQTRKSRQLVFPELMRRMKEEPQDRVLAIEFHRKFTLPFACLAMSFLALSLGISTKKGGKISGFVISLGIIFVYYVISLTTENMVRTGSLSPFIGMWCANIFLLILGIILYYYTSKEKTLRFERLYGFADYIKKRIHKYQQKKQQQEKSRAIKFPRMWILPRLFKIIDLYVAKKLIFTFFLVFTSLILVFYIITIMELIDDVVENNVAFFRIFEFIYYHTPEIISFALPVSVLTAVLLAFSMMSKNNELVAVQVSGISLYRLTLPAMVTGILISLAFFHIQENIMPNANKKKQEILAIIHNIEFKTSKEMNKNWVVGENNEFYFFNLMDKNSGTIEKFNVIYMNDDFSLEKRLSSRSARWLNKKELILENGFERNFKDNRPVDFNKFTAKNMKIEKGKALFTQKIDFPEFMNIKTLKKYIQYLKEKKSNTQKYEAKLYYKYAYPLSSLVMVLIAIPFSFLMGNRGTFFGIGIAIGISMVFWFAFAMFSALGSAAILSPFISAFAPTFIFTAVSIYLFMNIKT